MQRFCLIFLIVVTLVGSTSGFSLGLVPFSQPIALTSVGPAARYSGLCVPGRRQLTLSATSACVSTPSVKTNNHLTIHSSVLHPRVDQLSTRSGTGHRLRHLVTSAAAKMASVLAAFLFLFSTAPTLCNAHTSMNNQGPEVVVVAAATAEAAKSEEFKDFKPITRQELLNYKAEHESEEVANFVKKIDHEHAGDRIINILLKYVLPISLFWMFIYLFINNQ